MPTRQGIFEASLAHLRKQGRTTKSRTTGCLYRSPEGLMCAIGPLIPNDKYSPWMEGRPASNGEISSVVMGTSASLIDRDWLARLQSALHDAYPVHEAPTFLPWLESQAMKFAEEENLTYTRALEGTPQ